ncbi:MAG TPA: ribosome maturation factor RimM [Burkholderiales bacterium]
MGHVGAPFGVKGWVKVQPYTEALDALIDYAAWWLGSEERDEWRCVPLAEAKRHAKGLVARLADCADRDSAARLRGLQVGLRRSDLPQAEPGKYYRADLEGFTAVNLQDRELGRVEGFIETGASPVLVVKGDRERLIPFVFPVLREVDAEARRIVVDWGADY